MDDDHEAMQYASRYHLDLYCDTCYGQSNSSPRVYTGETFTECARKAKRDGWTIRSDKRTARCPRCKRK